MTNLDHSTRDTFAALTELEYRIDALLAERTRIVTVLGDFLDAPVTLSSLQPVLLLAKELNPTLKER